MSNQISAPNPLVKTYFSYQELVADLATLSDKLDYTSTISKAPPYSFYTKDGMIALGGNITVFMQKVKDILGVPVNPTSCEEGLGYILVSYSDYSPIEGKEEETDKIEVAAVDTPAKKRSQRVARNSK